MEIFPEKLVRNFPEKYEIFRTHNTTANPQTNQATWGVSLPVGATIHIHHRHLLLLIPKANTHFTVPHRVEGCVDLGTAVRVCILQWMSS